MDNTNYTTYIDRVIQPPPVVLGLRLKPLSLGHVILLKSAKSRFITGELKDITYQQLIGELVFALMVCSVSFDEFNDEVNAGRFEDSLTEYVTRISDEVKEAKDFNLHLEVNRFVKYIKDGTDSPLHFESNAGGTSDYPIDVEQSIIHTLMSKCNWILDDCYNRPLTETISAYLLYAHEQGAVRLISRNVADIMKQLEGLNAKG